MPTAYGTMTQNGYGTRTRVELINTAAKWLTLRRCSS